jgi:hypothetical protein
VAQWWISSSEHTVSELIPGAPDEVRDFYVELRNITLVHPLVVSVTTYVVRDRIPVGPFTMNTAYTARVEVPHHGDVHTEARQFPSVRLYGTVSFEPVNDGTRLTERILISAPRPLAAFTAREAVKAHGEMLLGIRQCFEQS